MESAADMLRSRAAARWSTTDGGDTWVATSPTGSERATVRAVPGGFGAWVWRRGSDHTGTTDPQRSNGPQIFESCDDALDHVEANLGSERPTRRPGTAQ